MSQISANDDVLITALKSHVLKNIDRRLADSDYVLLSSLSSGSTALQ